MTPKNKLKPPPAEAFAGTQLSLFQEFLCNSVEERDKLSNTIELWDGVPKYHVSRLDMSKLRDRGILPLLEREFQYGGRLFTVRIQPARIKDKNGKVIEYYPSAREELVEDALRKLAADQGHGFLENREVGGVRFTLHMLRNELKKRGHTMSFQQIIENLDIMSSVIIEIQAADGSGDYRSPILVGLVRVSKARLREDPKARWIAYFNPLVIESIYAVSFRQYDYHTFMSHSTQVARWIHKRLAHNYTNANYTQPYRMLFSTIQRDSGLLEYRLLRQAVQKLDEALEELKKHGVLLGYEKDTRRGERQKILDVAYLLTPHPDFVRQVKAANKRQGDSRIRLLKESRPE